MSELIVFDTSVLIDNFRSAMHSARIAALRGRLRNCSVVLAELWRGAGTTAERRVLTDLERNHPTLTPSEANWMESGRLLGRMRAELGWEPRKLRELHFDVLIALTARSHGAQIVTSNRAGFESIRGYRDFKLEIW